MPWKDLASDIAAELSQTGYDGETVTQPDYLSRCTDETERARVLLIAARRDDWRVAELARECDVNPYTVGIVLGRTGAWRAVHRSHPIGRCWVRIGSPSDRRRTPKTQSWLSWHDAWFPSQIRRARTSSGTK